MSLLHELFFFYQNSVRLKKKCIKRIFCGRRGYLHTINAQNVSQVLKKEKLHTHFKLRQENSSSGWFKHFSLVGGGGRGGLEDAEGGRARALR